MEEQFEYLTEKRKIEEYIDNNFDKRTAKSIKGNLKNQERRIEIMQRLQSKLKNKNNN